MNVRQRVTASSCIAAAFCLPSVATAKPIEVGTMFCGGSEISSSVEVAPGQAITMFRLTGGLRATPESSPFHLANQICHVSFSSVSGSRGAIGHCMIVDKDGDKVVLKFVRSAPSPGTAEFVTGTGKFSGIRGGAQYQVIPVAPLAGTMNSCVESRWSYELPN